MKTRIVLAAMMLVLPVSAWAQGAAFVSPNGQSVPAAVASTLNGSGQAVPATATNPLPVNIVSGGSSSSATATTSAPTYTNGSTVNLSVTTAGGLRIDGTGYTQLTRSTAGVGAMTAVPAGSTNGTALGTFPTGAAGARLYLPSGASVTYTIAATAPSSAPTAVFTVSAAATGPNWDESLSAGQMIYVTAVSGGALFRWF